MKLLKNFPQLETSYFLTLNPQISLFLLLCSIKPSPGKAQLIRGSRSLLLVSGTKERVKWLNVSASQKKEREKAKVLIVKRLFAISCCWCCRGSSRPITSGKQPWIESFLVSEIAAFKCSCTISSLFEIWENSSLSPADNCTYSTSGRVQKHGGVWKLF